MDAVCRWDIRSGAAAFGSSFSRWLACVPAIFCLSLLASIASAESSLAAAARAGNFEQLNELLIAGAPVDAPEGDGSTALLWATYHGEANTVELLLAAGADPDRANGLGITPLVQAARAGDSALVRTLIQGGADIRRATLHGETPLMAAARAGAAEAVDILLAQGSDPDTAEEYQDQTALMWAAAEGHAGIVLQLLEGGADPDLQARQSALTERSMRTDFPTGGFTAAMWAAREGHPDVLQVLAAHGASLNLQNGDGASALGIAIVNDRFDLAAELVRLGADVNDGSLYRAVEMRDAPLDWRAKDGSRLRANYPNTLTALDLMRVLLEAGADPNRPFSGQNHSASMCCDTTASGTPFTRTAAAADVEGLQLMLAHGADIEWSPDAAAGAGAKTLLQAAMDGGRGIGMAGGPGDVREGGDIPFREAANRNPADAMQVLLAAGADPNRRTAGDSTLLHDAARSRRLDIIEVLAANGAQLDTLNGDGLTALDLAEGRRAESGVPVRGPGPAFGGGPPGGSASQVDAADVAARLRELMRAAGVPIIEHGVPPASDSR